MSERQEGWYWMRVDNGQWEAVHVSRRGKISRAGTTIRMSEKMLVEFGPRIPSPEEGPDKTLETPEPIMVYPG